MFHNFNVNLRKNKGFLTYIPYIPIPEYGQSNPPQISMLYSPIYAVVQFSLETRYYFVSCPLHPEVEPFSGRVRPLLNKVMGFHRPFRSRGLGTSKFYFLLLIVVCGTLVDKKCEVNGSSSQIRFCCFTGGWAVVRKGFYLECKNVKSCLETFCAISHTSSIN